MKTNWLSLVVVIGMTLPATAQQTTVPSSMEQVFRDGFNEADKQFAQAANDIDKTVAEGFRTIDADFRRGFSNFDATFKAGFRQFNDAFDMIHATSSLTDAERKYAVDLLQKTKTDLFKSVQGLSGAQLAYKADSTRWSIAECLEHIALAETGIFMQAQGAMKTPADPARRSEIKVSDEQVVTILTNRSGKAQSPDLIKPTGRFPSAQASLQAFSRQRDTIIQYVQTVQDDLRTHYWKHFATGTIDVYQTLLLIAAHMERHRLQIEEVKAGATFPKY